MLKKKVYCKECRYKLPWWRDRKCNYVISETKEPEYTKGDPINPLKKRKSRATIKKYASPDKHNQHNSCKYYEEKC